MRFFIGMQVGNGVRSVMELDPMLAFTLIMSGGLPPPTDDEMEDELASWSPSGDQDFDNRFVAHLATCQRCGHDENNFSPALKQAVQDFRMEDPDFAAAMAGT